MSLPLPTHTRLMLLHTRPCLVLNSNSIEDIVRPPILASVYNLVYFSLIVWLCNDHSLHPISSCSNAFWGGWGGWGGWGYPGWGWGMGMWGWSSKTPQLRTDALWRTLKNKCELNTNKLSMHDYFITFTKLPFWRKIQKIFCHWGVKKNKFPLYYCVYIFCYLK